MDEKVQGNKFMLTIATFIIDKRKAFYLIFIAAMVYSVICMSKVQVNNDLTSYLPAESETRKGLSLMDEEFTTYGSGRIMVSNITYKDADKLVNELKEIDGIADIAFDDSEDHYKDASALFDVTFSGETEDEISKNAMKELKQELENYDVSISSEVGSDSSAELAADMNIIMILAVCVIFVVLLFTSETYAEVPVYLLVFGTAALLNKGTNFWFGEISFVTNSIAVVLQLALAIDYAIILCHRYMEEHETKDAREACIVALSKAIPEISSSSLTTISGMVAMMFMQFRIGFDMGIVLTKSIIFSLVTVFCLMPGLLLMFSKMIDKSHHKSFVPKISFMGKFAAMTKYIIPPLFIASLVFAFIFSERCTYIYDTNSIVSKKKTENKIAEEKINAKFGSSNTLAILVPVGNYDAEEKLLNKLSKMEQIDSVTGLANVEINDDYRLTDELTPRQFAELAGLDIEAARVVYSAYAVKQEEYGPVISGIDEYKVPIIDMFMFVYDQKEKGYVTLDDELNKKLDDLHEQLERAEVQLKGENYSRLLVNLTLPVEGKTTFSFIDSIRDVVHEFYSNTIFVGNSTSDFDLQESFVSDNKIITILTALFVMIILLFTFKSSGLPVLLVLTIQGSIWINFGLPYLKNENMFFMTYLIVSAIQMGATIDYAIVITSRYMELKQEMNIKNAMIESLNQAFPTIFTSGSILTTAGFIIGAVSSDPSIASIGGALGSGTLISIILVLCVLPQILLLGDTIINKTAFTLSREFAKPMPSGKVLVSGHVRGYISGKIDADVIGMLDGDIEAVIQMRHDSSVKKVEPNSPKELEDLGLEEVNMDDVTLNTNMPEGGQTDEK